MNRNSDCEANDEKPPKILSLASLIKKLRRQGKRHHSLYHYTQWDAFAKMMSPVDQGVCAGHRMMLLSPADKMNDKVEQGWGRNVFMACFSYSKYEDVAMWMNYGKRSPDAVRIRLDGDAVAAWYDSHRKNKREIFEAEEDGRGGFKYQPLAPDCIESIELADVAYVIHEKLMSRRHWGNVEYSREFYRAEENAGGFGWSNNIYDGEPGKGCPDLPAFFKKRGWGYERETRLVITLKNDRLIFPGRLAVVFDGPFSALNVVSSEDLPSEGFRCWRNRCDVPDDLPCNLPIMKGPWFDKEKASDVKIGSMLLSDVQIKSDYASEIEILSPIPMRVCDLVERIERRLHELEGWSPQRLTSRDGRFLMAVGEDLISAAKSINYHLDHPKLYEPNQYKLARLMIIDPRHLAELSRINKTAESYVGILREMAASEKSGWKKGVSYVRAYKG